MYSDSLGPALVIVLNFCRAALHALSHHGLPLPCPREHFAAPVYAACIADVKSVANFSSAVGVFRAVDEMQDIEVERSRRNKSESRVSGLNLLIALVRLTLVNVVKRGR